MSNSVNFKYGSTLEHKTVNDNDLIVINKAVGKQDALEFDKSCGSIYKGDLIVGTTEADKLVTTDSITVTGVNVGNLSNGSVIPAGTDIMSLLAQMLAKELGVSATKPTAVISGDKAAITVETGTVISGKTYTVTYTDGKYTGVSGYSYTLPAGCVVSGVSFSGVTGTKSQKDNTYSLVADSFTVTDVVSVSATVSYNAATNIPVTNFNNEITTGLIAEGTCSTRTITYTPSLLWFIGSSETKFDDMTWTSDDVRELNTSNWVGTTSATVTFPLGAKQQVIAIPAGRSFTAKDGAGSDITGTFSSTANVSVTCGGTHTENYVVYVAPANAGLAADSKATITLV